MAAGKTRTGCGRSTGGHGGTSSSFLDNGAGGVVDGKPISLIGERVPAGAGARDGPPVAAVGHDGLRPAVLSDLDPFANLQSESTLPPQTSCARLSDVLALVEPRLGAALLDAPGRAALHHVADRISAHLSPFWGLELRLGDTAPRADFLWEVARGGGGIPTLAGRNPHDPAAGVTRALRQRSPFWHEIGRFAEEWLDSPDWRRRLGNIWLEVDSATASSGTTLDVYLDRPSLFWGPSRSAAGSDRELLGDLAALGHRFYGLKLDQARIDAVADTIPAQGKVFQMGVMGARTNPAMRLCVKDLDPGTMEGWLAVIGWPGDRVHLRDTLARLEPLCGEIALNVDILPDRVGPKLGLEMYSSPRTLSIDTWQPLHDELNARGIARADKLAALADFPSCRRYRQVDVWRRTPPLGCPVLVTNLHHLKLVVVGDAVIEAKVYLGVFRPVIDYSRTRGDALEEGGWL